MEAENSVIGGDIKTIILIMGLPGSGKTTMATALCQLLPDSIHLNADKIRNEFNDWDFSIDGRMRQCSRFATMAADSLSRFVICDFVAPLEDIRTLLKPDYVVWMDSIQRSRYDDTNKLFVPPSQYHFRISEQNVTKWAPIIAEDVLS